jgi:multidrug resistance efflux pump
LKERNAEAEAKLSTIEAELRQLRADMARAETNFEKELITAQRLAEVSKELVTERDGRIKELEASLSSTEALLDAKKVEFDVALAEAKHAKARAEKEMENMKKQVSESVVSARETSRRSPHAEQLMHLSPAAGSVALQRDGLSATDLYTKYVEAEDALRVERTERAILQEHLDAIMFDLEKMARSSPSSKRSTSVR